MDEIHNLTLIEQFYDSLDHHIHPKKIDNLLHIHSVYQLYIAKRRICINNITQMSKFKLESESKNSLTMESMNYIRHFIILQCALKLF